MIVGIGIDLQHVQQIQGVMDRQQDRFEKKVFTDNEIAYCREHRDSAQYYAARWAVKEAFFKAMGTGITGMYRFLDVETIRLKSGQPQVILHGKAEEVCREQGLSVWVSISHSGEYAIAQIILSKIA